MNKTASVWGRFFYRIAMKMRAGPSGNGKVGRSPEAFPLERRVGFPSARKAARDTPKKY